MFGRSQISADGAMKVETIRRVLKADLLTAIEQNSVEVAVGCGCDLMSDVLSFIKPESILLTGLVNEQVIRTAEIADIRAICFVRGKRPPEALIRMAEERGIVLLATELPLFEACGRLYAAGLKGCSEADER
jgi:hypothetical protein